jgi:hypothetical protein
MAATLQLDPCDKCGRKVHHVCRVFNKRADKLLLCKGCDAAQGLHGKKPSFIRFSPESACCILHNTKRGGGSAKDKK